MLKRLKYAIAAFKYAWATYDDKKVSVVLEDYEMAISGNAEHISPSFSNR
jgi:hypothetical protein